MRWLLTRILGMTCMAGLCGLAAAQRIYTCVDAKGRTITADRPIPECLDRTQRELSRSGLVKRQVEPTLTAYEQAAMNEKENLAAEVRAREAEGKRRDWALLMRYPARAAHDEQRAKALARTNAVIYAVSKRIGGLADKRKAIDSELKLYVKDPSKAPASLKQRLDDNEGGLLVQQHFMAEQQQNKNRANERFDDELARLEPLWSTRGAPPGAEAASSVSTSVKH